MKLKFTVLGCGSSGGVPRIDGDWGVCDPNEPKNRRRRCSLLTQVETEIGVTNIVIDTSPDLREQIIDAGINRIDAVLLTHDHADQTHGIDDLRALVYKHMKRIPVWMDEVTAKTIKTRFKYCFEELQNSGYPSILEDCRIQDPLAPIQINGEGGIVNVIPFDQQHGHIRSIGYRIGNMVYSSDVSELPENSLTYIEGVDVWIVDALRLTPHPTHFHLEKTLEHIERLKVKKAYLTNLHIDMDYDTLCQELPNHIRPAYDGLDITLS
jgi:phosphoribosyl 1,2-cyclic phosphate phosphodiesterase